MITQADMTPEEFGWLLRIANHNAAMLTVDMDSRLKALGLAEEKLGGTGLSSEGKRVVDQYKLRIIKARKLREPQGH